MEALDGNAIAGMLSEHYGAEMTTVGGACVHCGATAQIAELRVYMRAPGAVARCRICGQVVIVVVDIHGDLRIDMVRFQLRPAASQ
jgi:stage V sporulation protein SpoVS